jgi:hypothetical protein
MKEHTINMQIALTTIAKETKKQGIFAIHEKMSVRT